MKPLCEYNEETHLTGIVINTMAYIRSNVIKINANVFMVLVTRLIDNVTLEVTFNPNGSATDIQNAVVQTFAQYDSDTTQIAEITTEIDSVLVALG